MSDLEMAIQIACEVHRGQGQQESGDLHIMHVLEVVRMFPVGDLNLRICAALHDAIELNRFTWDDLENCKFSSEVIDLLKFLKRVDGESIKDYIHRVDTNNDARAIKIAEYTHLLLNVCRNVSDKAKRDKLEKRYRYGLEYWQRKR